MALDPVSVSEGFLAHLLGGVIGGLAGWLLHTLYGQLQRRKQHAQFDREISEFVAQLRSLLRREQIPSVMARVVPLASKATFGTQIPPLKEEHLLPAGIKLNCRMCERSIEPSFEGRCPTCKLGCSSYHDPVVASKSSTEKNFGGTSSISSNIT